MYHAHKSKASTTTAFYDTSHLLFRSKLISLETDDDVPRRSFLSFCILHHHFVQIFVRFSTLFMTRGQLVFWTIAWYAVHCTFLSLELDQNPYHFWFVANLFSFKNHYWSSCAFFVKTMLHFVVCLLFTNTLNVYQICDGRQWQRKF